MPPQFGWPEEGRTYKDRPAAFGVALKDGKVAVVKVDKGEQGWWFDLPGGAIDPGEDAKAAVIREFGEETGLIVSPSVEVAKADQYFINTDGEAYNNRGAFFAVQVAGEDAALKCEDDHTLIWLDPDQALRRLRHDAHGWALAAFLRRGVATGPGRR
jgi:8-oxo-dGTP diphosphatase